MSVTSDGLLYLHTMTTSIVPYSKTIPLTQGKFTIVGYWWYEWLNQWKWYAKNTRKLSYAARTIMCDKKRKTVRMHRVICNSGNLFTDHVNGDGLLNTDCNLRKCTQAENMRNVRRFGATSRYNGVSISNKKLKGYGYYIAYRVQITLKGVKYYIGMFPYTPEGEILAAKAYDNKARELHGEFANLNFP